MPFPNTVEPPITLAPNIHMPDTLRAGSSRYHNIPNRSPGGLAKSLGGSYIRFREPGVALTKVSSITGVPLIGILRYDKKIIGFFSFSDAYNNG